MKTPSLIITASMAAALLAAPAFASGEPAAPSVSVTYKDLDLATAAGVQELDRRLDKAAREVCKLDTRTTGTRLGSTEARNCYKETKTQLEKRVAALVNNGSRG